MQPYQLIIFDWEGTLGDTLGQILKAIEEAANRCHLLPFDTILAHKLYNSSIRSLLKKLYPHLSDEAHRVLLDTVEHQLYLLRNRVYLLPGSEEFVAALNNAKKNLAIASNKNNVALQRDLQITALDKYFKFNRCANQTLPKPNPLMLEEILDFYQITSPNALMIGDSESDILMARSIGMDAVGIDVSSEVNPHLSNAGAKEIFQTYERLSNWFFN